MRFYHKFACFVKLVMSNQVFYFRFILLGFVNGLFLNDLFLMTSCKHRAADQIRLSCRLSLSPSNIPFQSFIHFVKHFHTNQFVYSVNSLYPKFSIEHLAHHFQVL